MKTVPLYEGAEKKSYYKYFQPIEHVSDDEIKKVKVIETDVSLPPKFSERAIIQTEEYTPVPEGIYLMDDGTIFVSAITPTPELTGEMLDWWIIWHQLDSLRYALWNPEDHYDVKISDKDRRRILDESLSIRERGWGITTNILESMNGEKPFGGALKFEEPSTVGLKNELIGGDYCQAILVANNVIKIGPIEYPVFMCELLRKNTEGKNEWVVAAWMGHGVKNGKDVTIKLPKFIRKIIAKGMPTMFIVHNHKEVAHLCKFLPELYVEQKDNWIE